MGAREDRSMGEWEHRRMGAHEDGSTAGQKHGRMGVWEDRSPGGWELRGHGRTGAQEAAYSDFVIPLT